MYFAGEKRRIKDRFRVFDRAVSFGKELSDGKVADKNYVWFSEWQFKTSTTTIYSQSTSKHIASSRITSRRHSFRCCRFGSMQHVDEGVFEKRYDELCQILNIRQYHTHHSSKRTLGPSLDELKQFGYLADWQIERTSDGENYKIVFLSRREISPRPSHAREQKAERNRRGDDNIGTRSAPTFIFSGGSSN